jgi:hypothetical protein
MRWFSAGRERLRALFCGARQDAEMEDELRFHLDTLASSLYEYSTGTGEGLEASASLDLAVADRRNSWPRSSAAADAERCALLA